MAPASNHVQYNWPKSDEAGRHRMLRGGEDQLLLDLSQLVRGVKHLGARKHLHEGIVRRHLQAAASANLDSGHECRPGADNWHRSRGRLWDLLERLLRQSVRSARQPRLGAHIRIRTTTKR